MTVRDYVAPATVEEAVAVLAGHGAEARVLAGGTDLIVQVRERRRALGIYVDLKTIPELTSVSLEGDGSLRVGAATPCARIYRNAPVAAAFPGLIDSASLIGGVQIQARASLGGNLCNSSPAADSIPTLIALGASCEIASGAGRRMVDVATFCTGPGQNILQPGEFVTALVFPAPAARSGAAFERFIPRNEMDIAVANAAAQVTLSPDGQRFESARIAVGAVAPTPLLVRNAGEALAGKPVSAEAIDEAAAAARGAASPITDMRGSVEQRKHLASVLVRRVINKAVERARAR